MDLEHSRLAWPATSDVEAGRAQRLDDAPAPAQRELSPAPARHRRALLPTYCRSGGWFGAALRVDGHRNCVSFDGCSPAIPLHASPAVPSLSSEPLKSGDAEGERVSGQVGFAVVPGLEAGEVAARLRLVLPDLSESDRRIADVILTQPSLVVRSSVSEVAESVGVSAATVVRACRRLGFEGFQDVKISLTQDLARNQRTTRDATPGAISESSSSAEVLHRVMVAGAQGLQDAQVTLDEDYFGQAVDVLARSSQVLFIGGGSSASMAADAAYWFTAIGMAAAAPADPMAQLLGARHLPSDGACVAISHSGGFKQTVETAHVARDVGATVIALTSFPKAPLTEVGHLALVAGGRSLGYRLEASAGRLVHLAVLDALRIAVALRRGQASVDALAHMADLSRRQQL